MSDAPLVSVIIPTVGRPSLRTAIECLKDDARVEIVVVDDSEHGLTEAEVAPARLLRGPRLGFGGPARNVGMDAARGAWLLMLDDDDMLHPRTVDWLEEVLRAVPAAELIVWRAAGIFDHLPPTFVIPPRGATSLQLGLVTNSFAIRASTGLRYGVQIKPEWVKHDGPAVHGQGLSVADDWDLVTGAVAAGRCVVLGHKLAYGVRIAPFQAPKPYDTFPLVLLNGV